MENKSKKLIKSILAPVIFFILLLAILVQTHFQMRNSLTEQGYTILNETIQTRYDIISASLKGQFYVLSGVADFVSESDNPSDDVAELTSIMDSVIDSGNFLQISYAEAAAGENYGEVLINDQLNLVNVSDKNYFISAVEGNQALNYIKDGGISGEAVFMLAVPVVKNEITVGVVFGSYSAGELAKLLKARAYAGEEDIFICDSSGNTLIIAEGTRIEVGSNVLELDDVDILTRKFSTQNVRNDMLNKAGNSLEFKYLGEKYLLSYCPVTVYGNEWYIFSTLTRDVLQLENRKITLSVVALIVEFMIVNLAFIALFAYQMMQKQNLMESEQELLKENAKHYKMLEDLSNSIMFEGNLKNDTIWFSSNYMETFGQMPQVVNISTFLGEHPNPIFAGENPYMHKDDWKLLKKAFDDFKNGEVESVGEYRLKDEKGKYIWTRIEMIALLDENNLPYKVVGKIINIDQQKIKLEQLQSKAELDLLTNIYNHGSAKSKIESFMSITGENGPDAFYCIDLDNFKKFNDTYGHLTGDRILQAAANKIRRLFRTNDIVGRLGGDEFVVYARGLGDSPTLINKAKKLCEGFNIVGDNGEIITVTCAVGISFFNSDGKTFDELYIKADKALYSVKAKGKAGFAIYNRLDKEG